MLCNHRFIASRILGHSEFWMMVLRFSRAQLSYGSMNRRESWKTHIESPYIHIVEIHKSVRELNSTTLGAYKIHAVNFATTRMQCRDIEDRHVPVAARRGRIRHLRDLFEIIWTIIFVHSWVLVNLARACFLLCGIIQRKRILITFTRSLTKRGEIESIINCDPLHVVNLHWK